MRRTDTDGEVDFYHAPASQTGALQDPSTTPKARVTYTASWHDAVGRVIATADYGTNGGSALSRPDTVPERSDTVLVTSMEYDPAGQVHRTVDPAGMVTCVEHDAVGRETERVLNCVESSSSSSSASGGCPASDDVNVTVRTSYTPDGQVSAITAVNAATGDQTTRFVYGTTLAASGVARTDLLRAEIYPDSDDTANPLGDGPDEVYDRIEFRYNRQGERTEVKDQNETVHTLEYDALGRLIHDRVTALGSGVDGAIRRISTTYEVRGMRQTISSWDNPAVGSGNLVNQVAFEYNEFGQLISDAQEHAGAVTGSTPKVQYGNADGSDNTIRPTSITYPDGRVIEFGYGTTDGINDVASRVESIIDDDLAATHLADYSYLGLGTFVEVDYTEPEIRYTLVDLALDDDPDTGDIYTGLDRFGRVKDCRWRNYGNSTDTERILYGYDRAGNRLWREQTTDPNSQFDELYSYDAIHRLKQAERGTLTSLKDAISPLKFAQCWSLDATGNWQNFREDPDGNSTWDLEQSRTANAVNEITDIDETAGPSWVTPAYDRGGNMIAIPKASDPTVALAAVYDAWNRLVRVSESSNTLAEHEYDGAKRRCVQKTYASGVLDETRHLFYSVPDGWQVLEERLASSNDADRHFVWGLRYADDLLLRDRDAHVGSPGLDERLYAMQDANWNVTAVGGPSAGLSERYSYAPYGARSEWTDAFESRQGSAHDWETSFAGYRWDHAGELHHVRNRIYHSRCGAWTQRDPAQYHDSPNLYMYSIGNPTTYVDPSGALIGVQILKGYCCHRYGAVSPWCLCVDWEIDIGFNPCCRNGRLNWITQVKGCITVGVYRCRSKNIGLGIGECRLTPPFGKGTIVRLPSGIPVAFRPGLPVGPISPLNYSLDTYDILPA